MAQQQSAGSRTRAPGGLVRAATVAAAIGVVTLAGVGASAAAVRHRSARVPAATLEALRRRVAADEAVPAFAAPGPKVSARVLRGKSALVMPFNSEIDTCRNQVGTFDRLGSSLGMRVTVFADSGNPIQWTTGVEDAASARDSALVMLCGIAPAAVAPQLSAAERAGVKVVDGNYNEASSYELLDAETGIEVQEGLAADVDDAVVNLKGAPLHALLVTSSSVVQGPAAVAAVKAEIGRDCGGICTLDQTIDVPIEDWVTRIRGEVRAALRTHRDVNAVFVAFDGMTTFVTPAIEQAHRAGLEMYTWGGSASVERLMLKGHSLLAADPGPDEAWDAYAAMDQVIRLLSHQPAAPVQKEVVPNRLWVPSNVKGFFGPGHGYGNAGYGGDAFANGFRRLWGLKPLGEAPGRGGGHEGASAVSRVAGRPRYGRGA